MPFSGSCFRIARIATTNRTSDAILSPSRLSLVQPGLTLLVQAYDVSEHAYDEALTPGQRRKLSLELAGKRARLAGTGAWMELLRVYVGDFLSHEVDARGDGTRTSQQGTTQKADTIRASDKMDSCSIRAASQILQTNTCAPQNS